jgi:hypothetical protein
MGREANRSLPSSIETVNTYNVSYLPTEVSGLHVSNSSSQVTLCAWSSNAVFAYSEGGMEGKASFCSEVPRHRPLVPLIRPVWSETAELSVYCHEASVLGPTRASSFPWSLAGQKMRMMLFKYYYHLGIITAYMLIGVSMQFCLLLIWLFI